ncbi:MAG: ZIP family metal transporter [Halolamina sp.]
MSGTSVALDDPDWRRTVAEGASVALFVASSALGVAFGVVGWKLFGIAWVAFLAMAGGATFGGRRRGRDAGALVWGYGVASGAMVTSAALFLLPQALSIGGRFGGVGVAAGLLVGFGSHTVGHRLSHLDLPGDRTVLQLTAHSAAAGAIIGVIYGNMPDLGPLLGLAIVSHKAPAGYAAASRLRRNGGHVGTLLVPAVGVGLAAVFASVVALPASSAFRGIVFGFAAGVFLHVAMDFLPRCEVGSEIHDALGAADDADAHALLDRLRTQAVISTAVGAAAVLVGWLTVA